MNAHSCQSSSGDPSTRANANATITEVENGSPRPIVIGLRSPRSRVATSSDVAAAATARRSDAPSVGDFASAENACPLRSSAVWSET